jgi:plasmid stability protein
MPKNLSIKNVPDDVAMRMRERARRHHRSLKGGVTAAVFFGAAVSAVRRGLEIPKRA